MLQNGVGFWCCIITCGVWWRKSCCDTAQRLCRDLTRSHECTVSVHEWSALISQADHQTAHSNCGARALIYVVRVWHTVESDSWPLPAAVYMCLLFVLLSATRWTRKKLAWWTKSSIGISYWLFSYLSLSLVITLKSIMTNAPDIASCTKPGL